MPYYNSYNSRSARIARAKAKQSAWKRGYEQAKKTNQYKRDQAETRQFLATAFPKGSASSIELYGKNWKDATPRARAVRRTLGYKGEGAYFSPNKHWAKGIRRGGQMLGGFLGAPYGVGAAGGAAGRHIAGQASKWLGFGNYNPDMQTNQLMGSDTLGNTPIQVNNTSQVESGDVIISQREYIGNVLAKRSGTDTTNPTNSGFTVSSYPLNPAIGKTFPFLSQIAQNFELYKFEGLAFQYNPTSGELGGTNNALGKVIVATNYDPEATDFISSVQMENYDYAQASKPSVGMVHGVETAANQMVTNLLYCRTGDNINKSLNFTDLGKFEIATEGIPIPAGQDSLIVGELWVTYTVRVSRALLYSNVLGGNIQKAEIIHLISNDLPISGEVKAIEKSTFPCTSTLVISDADKWTTQLEVEDSLIGTFNVYAYIVNNASGIKQEVDNVTPSRNFSLKVEPTTRNPIDMNPQPWDSQITTTLNSGITQGGDVNCKVISYLSQVTRKKISDPTTFWITFSWAPTGFASRPEIPTGEIVVLIEQTNATVDFTAE